MSIATVGISESAAFLDNSEQYIRNSYQATVTQSRLEDLNNLWRAWHESSEENWDGEGAAPIDLDCYRVAERVVEELPQSVPSPSITCEPDGHIDFEWYSNPRRVLSVSIASTGWLYWASLIGSERSRGAVHFAGEVPRTILNHIARVCFG